MFMQYANGGTLEELLANKSRDVSWQTRIRLACDVAKGIKYLHSRNVMHRDLTSKVGLSVLSVSVIDRCSLCLCVWSCTALSESIT